MSPRSWKTILLTASLAALTACGPESLILLEVSAPYSMPSQANSLEVLVIDADGDQQLLRITEPLDGTMRWPVEVLLEPSEATPTELNLDVTVSLNGTAVARVEAQHSWTRGKLNRVIIPELEPVP